MNVIQDMELYGLEHDVPIMQKEGINFMCNFIKEHQIKNILEIGSAIGYSAICMAMVDPEIRVVTIERDEVRYQKAVENIQRAGLQDRITLIFGDALETEVEGEFDLLFIDAAKAQYIKFFERYTVYLKQHGYVITDNLKFHGFVEHRERVMSRNLRQLVTKISKFVKYLEEREDYDTTFYDFGDGVGISQKR